MVGAWKRPLLPVAAAVISGVAAVVIVACGGSAHRDPGQTGRPAIPAGSTAVLDLRNAADGPSFAPGAVGLSIEPTQFAWRHLRTAPGNLVPMLRLLGPGVLRIGGNAGDLSFWTDRGERPPPWARTTVTPADMRRLAALARATGSRVVLQLNLGHVDPGRAAREASAAKRILGRRLFGIEIGNEPDLFPGHGLRPRPGYDYAAFVPPLLRYRDAIAAAAPGIPIVGPDFSHRFWTVRYARTVGRRNREITQHHYVLWACPGARTPTLHALIGHEARYGEDSMLKRLKRAGAAAGRPTAISETNSVGCRGTAGVSRTFGSALWALDWALRATSAGVRHIQFHDLLEHCTARTYSPLCGTGRSDALRLSPQPELYGLLAATRLEHGRFMRGEVRGPESLTAYATRDARGRIHVALDNMSVEQTPQPVVIRVRGRYRAGVERLVAPRIAGARHVRFGGAAVTPTGRFRPHARPLPAPRGEVRLRLAPGSAAVLTLTPAP